MIFSRRFWVFVFVLAIPVASARALSVSEALGDLEVAVYAPAWTWQKQHINLLVVIVNSGGDAAEVSLALVLPEGKEDHFEAAGDLEAAVSVPPGETVRHAFTNILALDGVPRQEYAFTLTVRAGGRTLDVAYPVQTIRGAVVNPGAWAAFLPAILAAAWCSVFIVVMRRFGARGAWMTPSAPMEPPENPEPWMVAKP